MANSKSLLVYVLALVLVVCGESWVSANTIPIVAREQQHQQPSSSSGGPSSQSYNNLHHQQQKQQQQYHPKHEPSQQVSQQQNVETLPTLSSVPAASPPLPPKQQPQLSHQPRLSNNAPNNMNIRHPWKPTQPYTSGYGYISGRTLNPTNSYMTDVDLPENVRLTPSAATTNLQTNPGINMDNFGNVGTTVQPILHNGVDATSAILGLLFGFITGNTGVGRSLAGYIPVLGSYFSSEEEDETEKEHIRTKRDVAVQENVELTELASVVLAAIQSGECMQRSICILGSRIGNSNKGRAVFSYVDKLIPESVQSNQYFVTMKKALKGGETFCDRFHCRFN